MERLRYEPRRVLNPEINAICMADDERTGRRADLAHVMNRGAPKMRNKNSEHLAIMRQPLTWL